MLYIDTSVLLPYTLTQAVEAARYRSTEKFFARISEGRLSAATSFYALHELYVFALDNAPDLPKDLPSAKPPLKRFFDCRSKFCPSCLASNGCDTHAGSVGCETRRTYHTRLPHRFTHVKPLLHTTHIFQPFPISFHTRLPKIIFNASMTDKKAGNDEKIETEPKVQKWFQDLTKLGT